MRGALKNEKESEENEQSLLIGTDAGTVGADGNVDRKRGGLMMENLYILSGRRITVRDKLRKVLTVAAALVLRTLAVCGFLGMILGMGIFVERSAALGLLIGAVSVLVMIGAAKADGCLDVTLPLESGEE